MRSSGGGWSSRARSCMLWFVVVVALSATARPAAAQAPPTTCFWTDVVDRDHYNILLPDSAATYWYSRFVLPPGGKVVVRGRYPRARSFFTWAYDVDTPTDG